MASEFDQNAYDEACSDFWGEFMDETPSIRKLWDAAAASGYQRGYAAAKAEIIKAVAGLLEEPKPVPLLIEGPKPEIAEPAEELPIHPPVAPEPPKVAQNPSDLGKVGGVWTPARNGVLIDHYPTTMSLGAIVAMVNALPGPAVQVGGVRSQAMQKLGLRRGEGAGHRVLSPPRWTLERDELLKKLYPTEPLISNVDKALNRLPGPIVTRQAISQRAGGFGLRRPPFVPPVPPAPPVESVPLAPPRPPPAPATKPPGPGLPEARADGFIYASFACIKAWADGARLPFDGRDVDRLNLARKFQGLPPVVVDWVPETSG